MAKPLTLFILLWMMITSGIGWTQTSSSDEPAPSKLEELRDRIKESQPEDQVEFQLAFLKRTDATNAEKLEVASELVDRFLSRNEPRILGLALLAKGNAQGQLGDMKSAMGTLLEAEKAGLLCAKVDPEVFFKARCNRALYMVASGEEAGTEIARLLQEVIDFAKPYGKKLSVAHPHYSLALLAENAGATTKAIEHLQTSFEEAVLADQAYVAASAGDTLVSFLCTEEKLELADQWVARALPWVEKSPDPRTRYSFKIRTEDLRRARGDVATAAKNLRAIAENAPKNLDNQLIGLAYLSLGSAEYSLEHYSEAMAAAKEASARLQQYPRSLHLVNQLVLECKFAKREYEVVLDEIEKVLPKTENFSFPRIKMLDLQSRVYHELGRNEEALQSLRLCGEAEKQRLKERAQEQMSFMSALFEDRDQDNRIKILNEQKLSLESQAKLNEANAERHAIEALFAERTKSGVIGASIIGFILCFLLARTYFKVRSQRTITQLEKELNEKLSIRLEEQSKSLRTEVEIRRNLEMAIERQHRDEALGKLTGGVAHDFNNLLTVVLNSNELIRLKAKNLPSFVTELLDASTKSAQSGASIVSQLLAYSRQQPLDPKPILVSQWLKSNQTLLRHMLGESITLEVHDLSKEAAIRVDAVQLTATLMNLLSNAKDSISKKGRVDLLIQRLNLDESNVGSWNEVKPGPFLLFEIRDNGKGIAEENLKRACEPFFTTKGTVSGAGLGLSTVVGFVKQSQGDFQLESKLGTGTTAKFILPICDWIDSLDNEKIHSERPSEAKRILLVDDQDDVRFVTSARLTTMGHEVREADSADSAIRCIENGMHPPDVVLSDVRMPGEMDGIGLRRWMEARYPKVRVILMSAYDEPLEASGGDFLRKPFCHQELETILKGPSSLLGV